ncbi:hypothetical protein INR49_014589, partial [Caranx melampygus]
MPALCLEHMLLWGRSEAMAVHCASVQGETGVRESAGGTVRGEGCWRELGCESPGCVSQDLIDIATVSQSFVTFVLRHD